MWKIQVRRVYGSVDAAIGSFMSAYTYSREGKYNPDKSALKVCSLISRETKREGFYV